MEDNGAPCWYELYAADPDLAQSFYGPLFGWSFTDAGLRGMNYKLARIDGLKIAGVLKPEIPILDWLIHFTVDDITTAMRRTEKLGGEVICEVEGSSNAGRFALLKDSDGSIFALVTPREDEVRASFRTKVHGHGTWHMLHAADPLAAADFYHKLLGWELQQQDGSVVFQQGGRQIGAAVRNPVTDLEPHWMIYFQRNDITRAQRIIREQAGRILLGPIDMPDGSQLVVATDFGGAIFGIVGAP